MEKHQDVTDFLKRHKRDALSIHVNNNTFGCDPSPMKAKALRVDYMYRGVFMQAVKQEGGMLVLPEDETNIKEISNLRKQLQQCHDMINKPPQKPPEIAPDKLVRLIKGYVTTHPDGKTMILALESEVVHPKRLV